VSGEVREQTDLATWLLACVAEDEKVARDGEAARPLPQVMLWGEEGGEYTRVFGYRHGPARVLAECDTKRRIIAECKYWYDKANRGEDYPALADRFEVAFGILRLLALPYRDRPGYVEDWSPDGR
jgi:hypothetical protein